MDLLEILLGLIPEALYFSLFLIFTKKINKKRVAFILLMVIEYILLKQIIHFNVLFQILYMILVYVLLKVLYPNKTCITDIFTIMISYILLCFSSVICFCLAKGNVLIAVIINRIFIFSLLFIFKNKMYEIEKLYRYNWNKNNKKKIIKATTFRCANVVMFTIIFTILNVCMLVAIHYNT